MQKIILDTNVLVSALIQKNFPYLKVTHLYFERKITLCLSSELMTEYRNVLNRDKFKRFHDFTKMALYVLDDIENHADFYKTTTTFNLIKDDSDNRLLELAHECKTDYLITGNTNDFIMPSFNDTIIISPKGYWEIHNQ